MASLFCRNIIKYNNVKHNFLNTTKRYLNLQEYQSKQILKEYNVNIQNFRVLSKPGDINLINDLDASEYVIKAQILAGGRGKGHFDSGFKGGVHITSNRNEIPNLIKQMVGHRLITKQTPENGILVNKVMVAQSVNIVRETYLGIVLNREMGGPVLIVSPCGGMDIEAVAEKTPDKIKTIPIDIVTGITKAICNDAAEFLEFKGATKQRAADEIEKLYNLFLKIDAVQIEINPLAETDDGSVISVDAKLNFDDNAKYRQKQIFEMDDESEESDPREVEAAKYNLNYIRMDGDIGCLVNGAGLAMATMDIIEINGGKPANFLDVGGGVNEETVLKAFQIVVEDKNVKAVLVNVFGGIVNCATIANGVVNASKVLKLTVPVIVRLAGTNVEEAKKILRDSGLKLESAENLDEAAAKAVAAVKKR